MIFSTIIIILKSLPSPSCIAICSAKRETCMEKIEKLWICTTPTDAPSCPLEALKVLAEELPGETAGNLYSHLRGRPLLPGTKSHIHSCFLFSNTLPTFSHQARILQNVSPQEAACKFREIFWLLKRAWTYFHRNASKRCSHLGKNRSGRKIHGGPAPRGWEHSFCENCCSQVTFLNKLMCFL